MEFCKNCGTELRNHIKFCESCSAVNNGAAVPQQGQQYQQNLQQGVDKLTKLAQEGADETGGMDAADIEKNKVMAGLAYILFFLPLISCPKSKYGRFHANQGLLLLITSVACGIIINMISAILTWRLWWLSSLISLVISAPVFIIFVIGLINGFTGKAKELPVIGKIRMIK